LAVALAATTFSHAAHALVVDSGTGNASIALVVYDPTLPNTDATGRAYIKDLGVDFAHVASIPASVDLSSDTNWTSFLTASNDPNLVYQVLSWNTAGTFDVLATGAPSINIANTNVGKAQLILNSFYTQINLLGIPTDGSIVTNNGNGIGYPSNAGSIQRRVGTNFTGNLGTALDSSIALTDYQQNFAGSNAPASKLFEGTFTLGSNGMLTFAPVPEPQSWVLLAGGIIGLGVIARRRLAAQHA